MPRFDMDFTLNRNDQDYSVEVRADFYHGELEDYYVYPPIKLTMLEQDDIENALLEAYND